MTTSASPIDKSSFLRALRPFSLVVALATCGLGVSLAWLDGAQDVRLIGLVLFNGLLLQIAVNLINDHRDLNNHYITPEQKRAIQRNTRIGYGVLVLAIAIGLYLVTLRGWPLFLLGLVGVFGAWGYTGGEINYKSRGLGILLVFLLMGVLLIGGAYYVVTGGYKLRVLWLSLPFSLLSSLLLLSNELRDYEQDLAEGIRTLSVRLGYDFGVRLYYGLSTFVYLLSVLLYQAGLLQGIWLLLVTALAVWQPLKLLRAPPGTRHRLTSLTGRLYLLFSVAFIASLWGALP